MRSKRLLPPVLCIWLVACGTVEPPEQHFYRLRLPEPSAGRAWRTGTLRVGGLQLAADLSGDQLQVALGKVQMRPYQLHRWAGPLDRLVEDAIVSGLARSRCFAQVKTTAERGGEDLWLSGRVLDFHQVGREDAWQGQVTLHLRLTTRHGEVVFDQEFSRAREMERNDPEALVVALSRALDEVIDEVLARAAGAGLFEQRLDARPPGGR